MRKLPAATLRALASLVLQGLASRAIASQLGLSKTTINNLAARIQSGTQEQRQQLAHMPDSVLLSSFIRQSLKQKKSRTGLIFTRSFTDEASRLRFCISSTRLRLFEKRTTMRHSVGAMGNGAKPTESMHPEAT